MCVCVSCHPSPGGETCFLRTPGGPVGSFLFSWSERARGEPLHKSLSLSLSPARPWAVVAASPREGRQVILFLDKSRCVGEELLLVLVFPHAAATARCTRRQSRATPCGRRSPGRRTRSTRAGPRPPRPTPPTRARAPARRAWPRPSGMIVAAPGAGSSATVLSTGWR